MDPMFLRTDQYRSEANLRARQSIYVYQQPPVDLPNVVLDIAAPADDAVVVDVGCGNGAYLVELGRRGHRGTTVGVDLSEGMLKTSRRAMPRAHAIIADASTLPLKDHTAALVLAMHMLYHVPDPVIAITEFRRVLAPRGRLVVGLNASGHLQELREAVRKAGRDIGLPHQAVGDRLGLGEGEELLRRVFRSVVRHDFVAELVLTDVEPLETYITSSINTGMVPEAKRGDYVQQVINYLPRRPGGLLTIRTHPGCLVCS